MTEEEMKQAIEAARAYADSNDWLTLNESRVFIRARKHIDALLRAIEAQQAALDVAQDKITELDAALRLWTDELPFEK